MQREFSARQHFCAMILHQVRRGLSNVREEATHWAKVILTVHPFVYLRQPM